jgi:hypothetical protein
MNKLNDPQLEKLWTSDLNEYVLIQGKDDHHLIFHVESSSALHIEDPSLQKLVTERMIAAGVKIVDELPPTHDNINGVVLERYTVEQAEADRKLLEERRKKRGTNW